MDMLEELCDVVHAVSERNGLVVEGDLAELADDLIRATGSHNDWTTTKGSPHGGDDVAADS